VLKDATNEICSSPYELCCTVMIFVAVFLFWFHYCPLVFVLISTTVWDLVITRANCCSRICSYFSCNSHVETEYFLWATLNDWSLCWTQTVFSVRLELNFFMQFLWSFTCYSFVPLTHQTQRFWVSRSSRFSLCENTINVY